MIAIEDVYGLLAFAAIFAVIGLAWWSEQKLRQRYIDQNPVSPKQHTHDRNAANGR
jgi:hypothetical protein